MKQPLKQINAAKKIIDLMKPSEVTEAILKYFDNDRHAINNLSCGLVYNELRAEIAVAINAMNLYYHSINNRKLQHDFNEHCELCKVLITSAIKTIEEQMRKAKLLNSQYLMVDKKNNLEKINAIILLMLKHKVISEYYNGSVVPKTDIIDYFTLRWNITGKVDLYRPIDEDVLEALKEDVPFLYNLENQRPTL